MSQRLGDYMTLKIKANGTSGSYVDFSSAVLIDGLTEEAELIEGLPSQMLQNGTDWYDIIGVRKTRTVTLRRNMNGDRNLWNQLYSILTNSNATHQVQIGTAEYIAHIQTVTRTAKAWNGTTEVWDDTYEVTFIPTTMNG